MWTRRDLLRAVGASAAVAALTPPGCGGSAPPTVEVAGHELDRLRDALRLAVDALGARLAAPFGFATVRRRTHAVIDLDQRGLFVEQRMVAIVGGRDRDGRWHERATDELSPAGVARATDLVLAGAPAGAAPDRASPAARVARDATALVHDPRAVNRATWLAEAEALAARVAAHASSRIVYRAAWLTTDDDETWFVGADVDHRQRLVRGQVGASLITWHGQRPVAGEATVDGRFVPAAALLADNALAQAADDALTLSTPGSAPSGTTTAVLAPELVAAIVDRLLALPALARAIRPAAVLTLTDDPTAASAIAGYPVDDDGAAARPTTLVADGQVGPALGAGSVRRAGPRWHRITGPCHLELAPGPTVAAALEADVVAGVTLEGLRDLRLDDDGLLVLRAARTRQLARGQRTGRVWDDVELRADVGELLAAVTGVSQDRVAIALADDRPARGALMPWLLTRGELVGATTGGPTTVIGPGSAPTPGTGVGRWGRS